MYVQTCNSSVGSMHVVSHMGLDQINTLSKSICNNHHGMKSCHNTACVCRHIPRDHMCGHCRRVHSTCLKGLDRRRDVLPFSENVPLGSDPVILGSRGLGNVLRWSPPTVYMDKVICTASVHG